MTTGLTLTTKLKMFDDNIIDETLKMFEENISKVVSINNGSEIKKQLTIYHSITKLLMKIRERFDMSEKEFQILEDILYSQCELEHTRVGRNRRQTRKFGFGIIDSIRIE